MKKYTCQKNNKIGCHPEERSELRILPIMEDNKERWSDSEHTKSSQERKDGRFRMTKKCHPGGFLDGRRVNESEPSPVSEQIEHTKTECLYAKPCERERNPRQFISGSVPFAQSANEQAQSENLSEIVQSDHPQDIQMLKSSSSTLSCKLHYIQQQEELQVQHDGYSLSNTLTKLAKTAAISLALSFFITAPAMAQDPVPVPTDNSAYTLTKVDQPGTNVITKYEWSDTENKYVPVNYRVDLKQTDYGYPEIADDTKTFTVTTPNADGSGNAFEYEIKYYVDSNRLAPHGINQNQNGNPINNDFVGLNVNDFGGAIYNNRGTIGNITGDFIGNYVSSDGSGGAIYNAGTIGNITGNFIGNYGDDYGGAIYNNNSSTIKNITGNFIGNYSMKGGAIYNSGKNATIGNITSDFIGNYVKRINNYSSLNGGAIYNEGTIGNITGDFIGNYASSNRSVNGGAIFNYRTIGNITGDFIGNYASSTDSYAQGGAIYNSYVTIGDITCDFIGNYASSTDSYARGGAIYNDRGTSGNITGDFIGNYAQGSTNVLGGAIYNSYGGTIGAKDEEGNVIGGLINSSFINNHATTTAQDGVAKGGAIWTNSSLNIIAKDGGQSIFSGNYTEAGGVKTPNAIYVENNINAGSINTEVISFENGKLVLQEKSSNFDSFDPSNNPALTLNATTNGTIRFDDQISGNADSVLVNNTYQMNIIGMAQNFEGKDEIYGLLGLSDDATVSEVVDAYFDYMVEQQFGDSGLPPEYADQVEQIKGGLLDELIDMGAVETIDPELISSESKGSYDLKITGDSTGKVILNNDIINANISLDNTNLYLGREDVFDKSVSLSLNSGSIYLNNNAIGTMHVPTLNLNGNTNISVDADLANKSMDRITADNYNITNDAKLNVNNVVLLSDAKEDVTNILFADTELKGSVAYTGVSPIAYSPIYKYEVTYNPDDGFFTFSRGGGASSGSYDAYNPAVLAPSVTQQAGAYTTQLQTFNFAFQHADTFMNIPYMERLSIIEQGKYALSPTGDATDVGTYSPLMIKQHDPGFWVKPYASFENIPLKNGPKVSNINYGTLIGYDTPIKEISNGFERVLTGYIGYNGASQRYSGVDAYQNGGLLGGTATFYKGNFFNATTLSVGATAGDATTMYGSENYTMLLAGIGNKTGYNFEFFNGGMILQPSMLISYTFVNTFDYTNGAGVRIESDPLHAIQLSPGLKLIGNTKNGWQPYIGVNMVWNLLDDSKVTANDVRLPEMSIKPYVQYGVGIQKRFKDRFLAFGQAMIHNGGRNGVSLTAGLRWKVGKE